MSWRVIGHASTCLQTENLHWRWRGAEGAQTDTRQIGSKNWLLYKLENDWNLKQESRINSLTHGILQLFIIYHFFLSSFFLVCIWYIQIKLAQIIGYHLYFWKGGGGRTPVKTTGKGLSTPPPPPRMIENEKPYRWCEWKMILFPFIPGTILKRLKMWHYLRFVL